MSSMEMSRATDFSCFDESPIHPLAPLRALEWFKRLIPVLNVDPEEFKKQHEKEAFTAAGITEQSLLERIKNLIVQALETGEVKETPHLIDSILDEAGVSPRNPQRAEMIVRTNMMQAYNRGAEEEMQELSDEFPAFRYVGIRDGRQGKDHEPHFDKYFPSSRSFTEVRGPRLFNCRCSFQPIHRNQWRRLKAQGAKFSTFAEDSEGHEHGKDGRFVSTGQGESGGDSKGAEKHLPPTHRRETTHEAMSAYRAIAATPAAKSSHALALDLHATLTAPGSKKEKAQNVKRQIGEHVKKLEGQLARTGEEASKELPAKFAPLVQSASKRFAVYLGRHMQEKALGYLRSSDYPSRGQGGGSREASLALGVTGNSILDTYQNAIGDVAGLTRDRNDQPREKVLDVLDKHFLGHVRSPVLRQAQSHSPAFLKQGYPAAYNLGSMLVHPEIAEHSDLYSEVCKFADGSYFERAEKFAEDAEGHEHGKDGRFVSTGQGESGGGESAAKESYQTKHEAWQQRQAARNQKVQALDSVDFSGEEHKTAAWNQVSAVDDAVRAGNGQGATEQVKAAVDQWGEHWKRAETTLKTAGANEADLAKLSRRREKADMAVSKKADAYKVQAEKVNVARVAAREIAAVEPKEPAEPNYPDEPKPEDYADEAEYEKAADAAQAQTDKMQEEYDKAYEKWSNAHDRWEQKANRADEKLDAEKDKLEERLNDLSEALEDHHDALAEEATEVEEKIRGRLDDEEAEDEEPDDEVNIVKHSDLYGAVCKFADGSYFEHAERFAEVEDTEPLLDVPNVRQLHNFDCGAGSTLSVARYFGVAGKRQEEDMIRELDTTPTSIIENGTRWQNIVRWFKQAGVAAEAHRNMSLDDLRRFVAEGKPVIVALQDYGTKKQYRDNESGHYVVVCGFYQGYVIIQDPSSSNAEAGGRLPDHHPDSIQDFGKLLVREKVFLDAWHDSDADGTVLTRFGIAVGPRHFSRNG